MSIQTSKVRTGAMIALGAAALILSGCASSGAKTADSGSTNEACVGVNSCKGTSDCKTAGNDCKGQGSCKMAANACKGQNDCATQGHSALTGAECAEKGGHAV